MKPRNKNLYAVGGVVFLPHPEYRGAWIKTDSSVVLADCNYCGAPKGQLCRGAGGPKVAGTHSARRMSANKIRQELRRTNKSRSKTILHLELK